MKYVSNIIQGDKKTYKIGLTSDGTVVSSSTIEHIYLTSTDLGIQKEGTYDSSTSKYTFELLPSETDEFDEGEYSFDITVDFQGDNVLTPLYEGVIVVLPKYNKVGS